MKGKLLVLGIGLILVFLLAGCEQDEPTISITGSGEVVIQELNLSGFDKVDISHTFKVEVRAGENFDVVIRADDNIVEHLEVDKKGHTLRIGLKRDQRYDIKSATLEAEVMMPELAGLELSGASHATVTGFKATKSLDVHLSGASSVRGDIEAGDARFGVSGASQVHLSGSAGDLTVYVSGASLVDLGAFAVRDARVDASGSTKVTVRPSGQLDAEASGVSQIIYLGSPTVGKRDTSGASFIGGQ